MVVGGNIYCEEFDYLNEDLGDVQGVFFQRFTGVLDEYVSIDEHAITLCT